MQKDDKTNYSILVDSNIESQFYNILSFNDRFIADELNKHINSGIVNLAVHAPYKAGKTHAVAFQLSLAEKGSISIIAIAYSALCVSTASSIKNKCKQFGREKNVVDYKQYQKLPEEEKTNVDVVVTTLNSLNKIMDSLGSRPIDYAIFDESEHNAKFLASKAIKNKHEFQVACNELSKKAEKVILLDANLNKATETFINYYLPERVFTKLVNTGQPWAGHTYAKYEGENQGMARISDLVLKGKNLFISSSSREQAERIYGHITKTLGINDTDILCAFDGKALETHGSRLEQAKIDPSKFADYRIVIGSPKLATGISIEVENHFDITLLFAVHDKDTPDPVQTMQQAFRVRNLVSKHIDVIYCDNSKRGNPITPKEVEAQHMERLSGKKLLLSVGELTQAQKDIWELADNYTADIEVYNYMMFKDYLNIIESGFKELGIKYVESTQYATFEVDSQLSDVRQELKSKRKENILSAEDITEDHAQDLKDKEQSNSLQLTESSQLERFRLKNNYHFSTEEMTREQLETYIEYADANLSQAAYKLANTNASTDEIKAYNKARNTPDSGLTMIDATSSKDVDLIISHSVDTLLADIVGFKYVDGEYSFNYENEISLRAHLKKTNSSRESNLSKLKQSIAKLANIDPTYKKTQRKLKDKPLAAVIDLLRDRFNFDVRKTRGKDSFTVNRVQLVVEHLEKRQAAGKMSGIFQGLAIISAVKQADILNKKIGVISGGGRIDTETRDFIIKCLSSVSVDYHISLAEEYMGPIVDTYIEKRDLSGVRAANIKLTERTGYSVK